MVAKNNMLDQPDRAGQGDSQWPSAEQFKCGPQFLLNLLDSDGQDNGHFLEYHSYFCSVSSGFLS